MLDAHGFIGATSRKIASAAQSSVASINYHFGSRDGLLTEVISSHMIPLMKQMSHQMEMRARGPIEIQDVLNIYCETMISDCLNDPILREAMVVLFSNPALARKWRRQNIDPYLEIFYDTLHGLLPKLDHSTVRRRFALFMGLVIGETINILGDPNDVDLESRIDGLIEFGACGLAR